MNVIFRFVPLRPNIARLILGRRARTILYLSHYRMYLWYDFVGLVIGYYQLYRIFNIHYGYLRLSQVISGQQSKSSIRIIWFCFILLFLLIHTNSASEIEWNQSIIETGVTKAKVIIYIVSKWNTVIILFWLNGWLSFVQLFILCGRHRLSFY